MKRSEILEKFGDVELYFTGYYKYTFSYGNDHAEHDGAIFTLYVESGGDADDIYRAPYEAVETVRSLADITSYIRIYNQDTGEDFTCDYL